MPRQGPQPPCPHLCIAPTCIPPLALSLLTSSALASASALFLSSRACRLAARDVASLRTVSTARGCVTRRSAPGSSNLRGCGGTRGIMLKIHSKSIHAHIAATLGKHTQRHDTRALPCPSLCSTTHILT